MQRNNCSTDKFLSISWTSYQKNITQQQEITKLTKDKENLAHKYDEIKQELDDINEDHKIALENEQVQVEGLTGDLKETKKSNKDL